MRLLAMMYLAPETLVEMHHTIALLLAHEPARFFHARDILRNAHLRRGIEGTRKLAAVGRTVVIDHDHRHVVGGLGVVDERIKDGIDEAENEKEDNHALVAKRQPELTLPHQEYVVQPTQHRSYQLSVVSYQFSVTLCIITVHTQG